MKIENMITWLDNMIEYWEYRSKLSYDEHDKGNHKKRIKTLKRCKARLEFEKSYGVSKIDRKGVFDK